MGHPGGEVIDLIEGFRAAGLEFVLTRHETSAAFMADAMAAASGTPGVCVATLGPGATNLVTGVAQAYLDRSPVLALTGQLPRERHEIVTHQKLELRALYAPITKWQARVDPASAGDVVDRALRVALAPRRGPVHLEVPSDVPGQEAPSGAPPAAPPLAIAAPPAGELVALAAERLRRCARPVILAGMDANDEATAPRLAALAHAWRVPVIASPKAKGLFREDDPLFLGTIEALGTRRLFDLVDTCDLVLMVGFDPVELDRDWTAPGEVIHIGPLPNDDGYYRAAIELVGPPAATLELLAAAAGAAAPRWAADALARWRDGFRAYVAPERGALTAQQVLAELRAALPEDAIATCDVGHNKAVAGQCWTAYRPKTFFLSNGLSSMGYGLPAAIGLKLLHRERAVACVAGDGGFAMTMAELETALRLDLALVVVVLADDSLSQIKAGQERRGYAATGTTFRGLDYLAVARAFGADGYDVRTRAECRDAFAAAARATRVSVVAAHVDPGAYRVD